MKAIWKFPLSPGYTSWNMPEGAQVLTVDEQAGYAQMWALVDPEAPLKPRLFCSYGTGHQLSEPVGEYVGTFQLPAEGLVFHVFEVTA